MNPKYTVVIITYNQERLISRAIDSILCQNEFVYEIIVSDDCSTDSTWDVIQKYHQSYPDLIKPFKNLKNLGIFGNIESTWTKVSGDIIFYLAGDDIFCKGLFEKGNNLIRKNNIDFKSEPITLYFDYKVVTPKGKEIVFRNSKITKHNPISLKIRNLISNRTSGVSKAVLDQYVTVNKDIGIFADGLLDIQTQLFSKKNYYCEFVGSVYYTQIGISSITNINESNKSYVLLLKELLKTINLPYKDIRWINYLIYRTQFQLHTTLKCYCYYFLYLFVGVGIEYGFNLFYKEFKYFLGTTFRVIIKLIKAFFLYFKTHNKREWLFLQIHFTAWFFL